MFQIQTNDQSALFCEISRDFKVEYFNLNGIHVSIIIVLPLLIILVSNMLIICKTVQDDEKRQEMQKICLKETKEKKNENNTLKQMISLKTPRTSFLDLSSRLTGLSEIIELNTDLPKSSNINRKIGRRKQPKTIKNTSKGYSKKITISLMSISFSYVILNIPYLISCFFYFYEIAFQKMDASSKNYLFSAFKLSEIFYIFNFSIKFYIYVFATGSAFRNQFKCIGKK